MGCLAVVAGQRVPESHIEPLVDQNAHLRTCEQKMFCFFESGDGRFTRDGRKSLQKVFECFSALQVVEERLEGHSGPAKHGSSAKNIRIFDDDPHEIIVSRAIVAGASVQILTVAARSEHIMNGERVKTGIAKARKREGEK